MAESELKIQAQQDLQLLRESELASYINSANNKINLLNLSPEKLTQFFALLGEKRFRAEQVLKWIYHRGADRFDLMTNIGKVLQARLAEIAEICPPEVISQQDSVDGTRKWAMRVSGGSLVETVYIPDGGRGTLCVSSQVGCSLDCSFCSTGKQGFQRDLSTAEIIGQVWHAARSFGSLQQGAERAVTNVVMMGMGEPLMNFDNVVDAMNLMMDDLGFSISKRRVTLSTSGVVPEIDRLASVTDVSLAISLHAPNDELRNQLVPINRKYPINQLLDACSRYMESRPDKHRVTTVEYTLIEGINDQPKHALQLTKLLKGFPCKINLIPFNPFPESEYKRPSRNAVMRFQKILQEHKFIATVRTTRGDDIDAACGQLVGKVQDRTRRQERYRAAMLNGGLEAQQATEQADAQDTDWNLLTVIAPQQEN